MNVLNDSQIKCVLMAAQYLNFTRAAEVIFMTQPVLSRQIAAFEKEVGITIFRRYKKTIQLTPAGAVLVSGLRETTASLTKIVEQAKCIQNGSAGHLIIGIPHGQTLGKIYSHILQNFEEKLAKVRIDFHLYNMHDLHTALENGEIDIALTIRWEVENCAAISSRFVEYTPHYLVIQANHPRYKEPNLSLQKLGNETFWLLSSSESRVLAEVTRQLNQSLGGKLKLRELSNTGAQNLWMESGIGVAVLNEKHMLCQFADMRKIPAPEVAPVPDVVAWRTENSNPVIPMFLAELKNVQEDLGLPTEG